MECGRTALKSELLDYHLRAIFFGYWQEIKTVLYPIPTQTTTKHRQYAGSGGGDEYVTPHRVAPL
mgnify:FL=1|jgi:hypothetical protein